MKVVDIDVASEDLLAGVSALRRGLRIEIEGKSLSGIDV